MFLSFNGGKDCTVLLDLWVQYLKKSDKNNKFPILCVYVQPKNSFEEVEDFVKSCETHYNINMKVYTGSIKQSLEQTCQENPKLKACIMGSRSTDPYCENLKKFQVSS
jgi:FAD synthetase